MTSLIELPQAEDTLRYRIQAERALSQDDVRVTVPVTALVPTRDHDQTALQARIRDALNAFIKADWTFSRIERGGEAVGFERVQLTASARVPSGEIYDLAERARQASREGLTLGRPRVDHSLSPEKVDEVVRALRIDILRQVQLHIAEFEQATGRTWRIGDVAFGLDEPDERPSFRTSKGAYRDIDDVLGAADESGAALVGVERIKLVATVTLRSHPPDSWASE